MSKLEDKLVYLYNLEWSKIHDDIGGASANIVFNNRMSYDEYKQLISKKYFILRDMEDAESDNSCEDIKTCKNKND